MTTLLVTGGRDFRDQDVVDMVLDPLLDKAQTTNVVTRLVHGGAKGADTCADVWGRAHGLEVIAEPVTSEEWNRIGRSAGHRRNERMIDVHGPRIVVAFPGGKGTHGCTAYALKRRAEISVPRFVFRVSLCNAMPCPLCRYYIGSRGIHVDAA